MASVDDVAQQVSAAIDKASKARDALAHADDLTEEAHDEFAATLRGARSDLAPDVEQLLATFINALYGMRDLFGALDRGREATERYLSTLTGEGSPQLAHPTQQQLPAQPPRRAPIREAEPGYPPEIPPERVERLRRELPPPVVPGTGQKTHGRWTAVDGEERAVVSGYGALLQESERAFSDLGLRRGLPNIASHAEIKLAAYMRNHHIRSATLVINNRPCEDGPFTCDELVPALLHEGYTLTVHGPDGFSKTYRGGAIPPWRKR